MIRHAAMLLNIGRRGRDGRSARGRVKGRLFNSKLQEFGERVVYSKPNSLGKDKLASRWENGTFIGLQDDSSELLIGTPSGVLKARSFNHHTMGTDKWSANGVESMTGLPWEPVPGRQGVEVKSNGKTSGESGADVNDPDGAATRIFKRRAVGITRGGVRKYGMTLGCAGCIAANRAGSEPVNHKFIMPCSY